MITFPTKIDLLAIECEWEARYCYGHLRQTVRELWGGLEFHLREKNKLCFTHVTKRWLAKKASLELTPWLNRLSRETGLEYRGVSYRGQKTVWGTCSREGRIHLNYKLLFLPPSYVNYVLIHELAHTIHFDHSKNFWALVECFVPEWKRLRYEVRRAEKFLPQWIY